MLIFRVAACNLILASASGFSSHRVSVGDLPRDIYIEQEMNKWLQKGEFEKNQRLGEAYQTKRPAYNERFGVRRGVARPTVLRDFESLSPVRAFVNPRPNAKTPPR